MRRIVSILGIIPLLAFGLATSAVLAAGPAGAVAGDSSTVFVNEIHYDNASDDTGEFVEIAGPAGTDLTGWTLVLYNGSSSVLAPYGSPIDLGGETIDDEGTGSGAFAIEFPSNGIQNGGPDGLALVDAGGTVVQFLSYEGSFTASSGPAAGMTSTDIGVAESSSTPIGESVQLTGSGTAAGDFTWTGPVAASPGTLNAGQSLGDGGGVGSLLISQYVEGSSFNKAIELQNRGTGPIDLSLVTVELFSNGNTGANGSVSLAGTLPAGGVHVLAHPSADPLILSVADTVDGGVINFNGDDAVQVALEGTVVDTFGTVGVDPGSQWSGGGIGTQNESLCRKDTVTVGAPAGFSDPSLEWDGTAQDTFDGLGATDCTTPITPLGPCADGVVYIHDVQGDGATTPCDGDEVTVTGIVTSLFEDADEADGFFLQEEDADADADPATSEGIFVFCRNACPVVQPGDQLTVTGEATEFFGMTQIDAAFGGGTFVLETTGNPLPTPTPLTLPAAGSTAAEATFETTEGMLVTFPETLVVSEYFQLSRYGQLVLTDEARPYQFTHANAPSEAGYAAFLDDLATRRIILDDDNNDQNEAITDGPDEGYYQAGGSLSTTNVVRGGDTIDGLTAVLHWSFAGQSGTDAWRLRPVPEVYDYSFTAANARPASPDDVGGRLTVASFNVLNYFDTVDDGSGVGCGPTLALECRGADSVAEFERQEAKIVAALLEIDADIVGLVEIENNADASLVALVDALNAQAGAGTYAHVDTGTIGTDAIKVGLIYQPAAVEPVGDFAVLDGSVDARFVDDKNRPMLTQTFEEVTTGARVNVSVNHLKSKGSGCGAGDDALDGSGNCDGTRTRAAEAIVDFLAADPTGMGDPDHLVLGDLNSYKMERPIVTLTDAGYTDLIEALEGSDAYSYVFDGQLGYLDYALANDALTPQVTGVDEWHINADEVSVYDYNDDVLDSGEQSFERVSETPATYAPDPYRASDHDPVIVGLALTVPEPSYACGADTFTVSELEALGFNVVVGTDAGEVLWGTRGNDAILALGGNDIVLADRGDDLVCGGDGRDTLVGGRGADDLRGEGDPDLLLGDRDNDTLDGGVGFDLGLGGRGHDECISVEFSIGCETRRR